MGGKSLEAVSKKRSQASIYREKDAKKYLNSSKPMKKKIRQIIKSLFPYSPERIYLFGSWARGEEDEMSDIDLVVIKQTSTSFLERLREISSLLPTEIGGVDILVYTPDEFSAMQQNGNAFAEMIAEEGRLIYDREAKN